jgi:hypothetical protein
MSAGYIHFSSHTHGYSVVVYELYIAQGLLSIFAAIEGTAASVHIWNRTMRIYDESIATRIIEYYGPSAKMSPTSCWSRAFIHVNKDTISACFS